MMHFSFFFYIFSIMIGISTITIVTSVYFKSKIKYLRCYVLFLWLFLLYVLFNFFRTYILLMFETADTLFLLVTFLPHFVFVTSFCITAILMIHELTETPLSVFEIVYCTVIILSSAGLLLVPGLIYQNPERIYSWYFKDMSNTPVILIFTILLLISVIICVYYYPRIKFVLMKKLLISYFYTSLIMFLGGNFVYTVFFKNPSTPRIFNLTFDMAFVFVVFFDVFMLINFFVFLHQLFSKNNIPETSLLDLFSLDYNISRREKDVLTMVIHGMSNQEIAESLFLSKKTVETHLSSIYKKINIGKRDDLILLFNSYKLMTSEKHDK